MGESNGGVCEVWHEEKYVIDANASGSAAGSFCESAATCLLEGWRECPDDANDKDNDNHI